MADTVMTVRLVVKEMAQRQRRPRQLHAQAAGRGAGIGHAHPPVAVRGRHQRLLRRRRPVRPVGWWPSASSPASCATPMRSPPSPTSGSTPTSASSSATRRRSTCRGPATTARRSSGCRWSSATSIESTRVEYRAPDTACNPYLAFAVILAAGLKGIEEGYELPREAAANLFAMTPEELAADDIRPLPGQPQRGGRRDGALRARGRDPRASTSSNGSSATSGPSGPRTRPTSASSSSTATSRSSSGPARPGAASKETRQLMEPLLCFPEPFPSELALALERAGYPWKAVARPEHADSDEPDDGWAGAVVCAEPDAVGSLRPVPAGARPRRAPAPPAAHRRPHPARRPAAARGPLRRLLRAAGPPPRRWPPVSPTSSGARAGGCAPS